MISRAFTPKDLMQIREMHEEYYSEFDFPDFLRLINGYVVEDDEGIIMAGGVELVGEAVLVTNKARNPISIGRALVESKAINLFTCKQVGIRDLYAFVNNNDYAKHLIQHGFVECDKALNLRIV
jgi:hypothetical protein